jgi:hypothetical protein
MAHSKKKNPARETAKAGEVLGSNNGSGLASKNVNSRIRRNLKAPAIELPFARAYIQTAMSAATPRYYDAHFHSPANRVGQNTKSRLRRKQESNCGALENNTPAVGASQAGAACVVDTGINEFDSQIFYSKFTRCEATVHCKKETPAAVRGKLGVEGWTVGDFAEVPEEMDSTSWHLGVARACVLDKNILAQRKTPAKEQPGAREKFRDI